MRKKTGDSRLCVVAQPSWIPRDTPKSQDKPLCWFFFGPDGAVPAAPFGAEERDHECPGVLLLSWGGDAAFRGGKAFCCAPPE